MISLQTVQLCSQVGNPLANLHRNHRKFRLVSPVLNPVVSQQEILLSSLQISLLDSPLEFHRRNLLVFPHDNLQANLQEYLQCNRVDFLLTCLQLNPVISPLISLHHNHLSSLRVVLLPNQPANQVANLLANHLDGPLGNRRSNRFRIHRQFRLLSPRFNLQALHQANLLVVPLFLLAINLLSFLVRNQPRRLPLNRRFNL